MINDEKGQIVTTLMNDDGEDFVVLSLEETEPVELEEVEMPPGYLKAASRHLAAGFLGRTPDPSKGAGGL